MKSTVLLCGNMESPYLVSMHRELNAAGIRCEVLDIRRARIRKANGVGIEIPVKLSRFKTVVQLRISNFLRTNKNSYDFVHVHLNSPAYSVFFLRTFKAISRKLFVSVWGSDFNRASKIARLIQRRMYKASDLITFNSRSMMERFRKYYAGRYNHKMKFLTFGLDSISELKLTLQNNVSAKSAFAELFTTPLRGHTVPVIIGYNGSPAQNHIPILETLANLREDERERIFLVVPVTYGGSEDYIESIRRQLEKTGVEYRIITERMSDREMALLRTIGGIFIHMQTTDAFSASVQEHLYAGSHVVNGAWLDYDWLRELGVEDFPVEDFQVMGQFIRKFLHKGAPPINIEKNRQIIAALSDWSVIGDHWIRLYTDEFQGD
jgi:hypothetical protein